MVALLGACSSATETARPPANVSIVAGSGQAGFAGVTLSKPLVVKVTAADGTPVAGQIVDFSVTSGQAALDPVTATTGANGLAQTQATLGSSSGSVQITATVRGTSLQTVFTAAVQSIATNFSCSGVIPATLTVGEVRTSLPNAGICLHADATSEYMVHAFYASTVPSAQTQVGIAGFGITTPIGSSAFLSTGSNPALSPGVPIGTIRGSDPARDLDLRLRQFERTVLAPRMSAARSTVRNGGALRSTAAAAVGQVLPLNVNEGCDEPPRFRFGRVAAVTSRAVVVADTGNPGGGFTDAEYQSVGVTFDTLVDPLDQAAFGAPTDIDANGRIVIFFTRAVNELTPAKSQSVVEGFFNARDLFPRTASGTGQTCSGSNFAEMFYVIVPDPSGTINGNVRTKSEVQQLTIAVIGHEYQHLINAARRLYINNANNFEEVWLNEGLSHIAEELLYYRVSGLTPRQNLDGTAIASSQRRADAFNEYQSSNFGRCELFLRNPMTSTPYADNDSLANRGAIWGLLRYAADHQGTVDGTVWQQLVNATTTGFANLSNVFGPNILDRIRDWSISVYTDDLTSTALPYQEASWNFRSVYPRIGVTPFPLAVFPLTPGVQTTQTVSGGGSLYTTLGIQTNVTAAVAWSVATPTVQISIVRTK